MNSIFLNEYGRLRSGWRAAIFAAAFIFLEIGWGMLADFATSINALGIEHGSIFLWGVDIFVSLVAAVALGWLLGKTLEDLPPRALGWTFHRGWFPDLLWGLLIGTLTLLIACGICLVLGKMSFRFNDQSGTDATGAITITLASSAVMFIIGAAAEESLFRGYLMQTFARAKLAWLAIVFTSIFFAVAHLANPNSSILALVNTVLAGLWFSAAYLKTRSLWLPFAAHFAWNWVQGAIFGIPVSGITRVTPAPLLLQIDSGPAWLTGGSYGIEGGIACTAALLLSTIIIWFLPVLKADEEMLALTSGERGQ